jgi:hypothetical protein
MPSSLLPILPHFLVRVLARACLCCLGAPIWVLTSPCVKSIPNSCLTAHFLPALFADTNVAAIILRTVAAQRTLDGNMTDPETGTTLTSQESWELAANAVRMHRTPNILVLMLHPVRDSR